VEEMKKRAKNRQMEARENLLFIREDGKGFANLLEFGGVLGILIGVICHGQLAICSLDQNP